MKLYKSRSYGCVFCRDRIDDEDTVKVCAHRPASRSVTDTETVFAHRNCASAAMSMYMLEGYRCLVVDPPRDKVFQYNTGVQDDD